MRHCEKCNIDLPDSDAFCPECGVETDGPANGGTAAPMMSIGGMPTIEPTTGGGTGKQQTLLEAGAVFADRYEIEERIGGGGMGIVYRANDRVTSETIALKLIRPDRSFEGGELKRLIREGVTTRDIRHPNVVAVYEVGQQDGQPFLTMEYVEGKSLREWLRVWSKARQTVPMQIVTKIIAGIVSGLQAAHAKEIIHRDLKPENVMISGDDSNPQVRILDFGIARAVNGKEAATQGMGTRGYMAPEQVTQADLAGPEADIYAVSVMFYELLVGVLPQGHWQPPSSGRADVPRSVDQLIEQGLSNRPANRPQTAAEYLARLPRLESSPIPRTPDVPDTHKPVLKPEAVNSGGGGKLDAQALMKNPAVWIGSALMCLILGGGCVTLMALAMVDDSSSSGMGDIGSNDLGNGMQDAVMTQMPNLIGSNYFGATTALDQAGLGSTWYGPQDGTVLFQNPPPGTALPQGTTVEFTLSY